jgi:hypothetical protein
MVSIDGFYDTLQPTCRFLERAEYSSRRHAAQLPSGGDVPCLLFAALGLLDPGVFGSLGGSATGCIAWRSWIKKPWREKRKRTRK